MKSGSEGGEKWEEGWEQLLNEYMACVCHHWLQIYIMGSLAD